MISLIISGTRPLRSAILIGQLRNKGQRVHVIGAGINTQSHLEARSFIERRDEDYGPFSITAVGEAEWLRIVAGF
ncbi:hypothetical protein [Bradyrhizobium canariense]|uniref:Uncharacterized protein n=1 Tax=Bradyrhizobium canariense TaxID=255045 RepID=A0A1H1MS44_9BRAD|nr:hypothetical protein [Bradyrhizobium canariense]SDR89681.1 hypothetical protein SAMN05444158_0344 [Bradyrhizobium canariense]